MVISLTGEPSVVRLLSRLCVTFLRSGNNSTQLPVFTLQCQPAKRGEREGGYTDSRPGLRASLGGVWKPPEPPPLRQRRSAVNEEGAGRLLQGRAFPPVRLLPDPLITGNRRPLEVHSQMHISKVLAFMSWLPVVVLSTLEEGGIFIFLDLIWPIYSSIWYNRGFFTGSVCLAPVSG